MITFRQFLLEDNLDIPKLCAKFITESKGLPLYRGSGKSINEPTIITPRKDRSPLGTDREVHKAVDDWFKKNLDMNARTAGLFAIGDYPIAHSYGHVFFVLPIGDFKYVWGKSDGEYISDTYDITIKINRKKNAQQPGKYWQSVEEIANEILSKVEWFTTNLSEAIEHNAELSIICEKAILVPTGDYDVENLKTQYKKLITA